jgi:uncharacterized glyoxalase superfamily protein PhnB
MRYTHAPMTAVGFTDVTPCLKTNDIRGTIDFYVNVLGFVADTMHPPDDPTLCILDHGAVRLAFVTDPQNWYQEPRLAGQLWIHVTDVMALHARVAEKGVAIEWGPEVYSYGRREFAIKDNNGYLLALSEATSDPPTCD